MLRDNRQYYYEDCYMYFTFAGVYSKQYNLFITNSKGFTKVNSVGGSVKTETPDYQNRSYYLGTTKSKKTIKIDVATEGLTYDQYKEMMDWLEEGRTGFLYLDSDVDWGWDVVISKMGDATQNFTPYGGVYEFNIQFETIGTYCARSPWDNVVNIDTQFTDTAVGGDRTAAELTIANKFGVPEIVYTGNSGNFKEIYLPSVSNRNGYLDYSFEPGEKIDLEIQKLINRKNNQYTTYIKYAGDYNLTSPQLKYLGASNYIIVNDSSIIENNENFELTESNQNSGLMVLDGYTYFSRDYYTIDSPSSQELQLTLRQDDIDRIQYWNNLYVCISWQDLTNTDTYEEQSYDIQPYPYKFYSCIWFDPQFDLDNPKTLILPVQNWNRKNFPTTTKIGKTFIIFGQYNKVRITNSSDITNPQLIVHKYNNI